MRGDPTLCWLEPIFIACWYQYILDVQLGAEKNRWWRTIWLLRERNHRLNRCMILQLCSDSGGMPTQFSEYLWMAIMSSKVFHKLCSGCLPKTMHWESVTLRYCNKAYMYASTSLQCLHDHYCLLNQICTFQRSYREVGYGLKCLIGWDPSWNIVVKCIPYSIW